jgi:hypothetical protein
MKGNRIKIVLFTITLILVVVGITVSLFKWSTTTNTSVVVNTNGYDDYIVYTKGEDTTNTSLEPVTSFNEGMHSSITIYKKSTATNIPLYAHFYIDVSSIGTNLTTDNGLKWAITKGDETSTDILASGTFKGATTTTPITLKTNELLGTTEQKYTVWIYLVEEDITNEDIVGESLNTTVRVEVTGKGL